METVFPGGCGLFQQDNAPCHKAKMVQEWLEEHNLDLASKFPNLNQTSPIQPCNLQDLKDLLV